MLANYDKLSNFYKMPSMHLLQNEKDHYVKHINKLRSAAKYMVKQAKLEAKEVAWKVLMKQVEHVKNQFEAEIKEVLYHNSFILDESNKKDFQIKHLISKILL